MLGNFPAVLMSSRCHLESLVDSSVYCLLVLPGILLAGCRGESSRNVGLVDGCSVDKPDNPASGRRFPWHAGKRTE